MNHEEFNILLQAYANNAMTQEQWERFRTAVQGGTFDAVLEADFAEYLKTATIHGSWNETKQQNSWRVIGERTGATTGEPFVARVHRVHFLRRSWFRYAAAIIILLSGISIYYSFFHTSQPGNKVVQATPPSVPGPDILPGSDRATLTLSNGEQVQLNNATSETIKDGTLSIENDQGQLSYPPLAEVARSAGGGSRSARTATNTMSTPRGGQYQLTLSDGTTVWLNAASSITYPVEFTGTSREVSVTGEAYFEVATNERMPFRVKINEETSIQVLGTRFNVNAYADEPAIRTTLLEGRVNVVKGKEKQALAPGQHAIIKEAISIKTVNANRAIAWKNGVFNFEDAPFDEFMRQIARWYDLTIVYKGAVPRKMFRGDLGRNLPLSEILDVLSLFDIQYSLNNKQLTIL